MGEHHEYTLSADIGHNALRFGQEPAGAWPRIDRTGQFPTRSQRPEVHGIRILETLSAAEGCPAEMTITEIATVFAGAALEAGAFPAEAFGKD
ncbi:hypothetical protein [Streptomyces uncialis]|uniref:hypothetical protein n=1 Tax=Streptomyces uncialis TaxID=1048205 RepID=UPI0037B638C8